jgi:hypothetical protein
VTAIRFHHAFAQLAIEVAREVISPVIVRLDRAIQYSGKHNVASDAAAHWITRFRG